MKERVFNIFLIFDEKNVCHSLSYTTHNLEGSDELKLSLLQEKLDSDYKKSILFTPSLEFTQSEINTYGRIGRMLPQIEELFIFLKAPITPLYICSPVIDDKVFFNASVGLDGYSMDNIREQLGIQGSQVDWLIHYTKNDGIDIPSLINDDYLKAIKLLYSNELYVSAMKLLLTCIDSLAYIEFGSDRGAFVKWMKEYADLSTILITPEELWELRNGLLHMSNLHASKVVQRKVRRVSFYVNSKEKSFKGFEEENIFYFDFRGLIDVYINGVKKWLKSYNTDRDKFPKFVERYDQTVSDSRFLLK